MQNLDQGVNLVWLYLHSLVDGINWCIPLLIASVLVYSSLTYWSWDKMVAIFADDIFKWIFLNENTILSSDIS